MTEDENIEAVVISMTEPFCPSATVDKHARLLEDLRLASDDFTALALRLEKRFDFRADRKLWASAVTVQDMIDLVKWQRIR